MDLNTSVAQEHLRLDALPDTTAVRHESNTGPLGWKTHTLPIAPRPPPLSCIQNVESYLCESFNLPLS